MIAHVVVNPTIIRLLKILILTAEMILIKTRGSWEPVIAHLLSWFSITVLIEKFPLILFFLSPLCKISTYSDGSHLGWRVGLSHLILKVDQLKILSAQVSEQKIIKVDFFPQNKHNLKKSAKRKFHRKTLQKC